MAGELLAFCIKLYTCLTLHTPLCSSLLRSLTETAEIRSVFFEITDLFDGKANTIESALI